MALPEEEDVVETQQDGFTKGQNGSVPFLQGKMQNFLLRNDFSDQTKENAEMLR